MNNINKVALIGGGVIGAGWAARLLINGIDVVVCDPSDQVERRLNVVVDNALRAYRRMTLAPVERRGRLSFVDSVTAAVANADFVQESGPERIEIKQAIMKEVCDNSGPEVIVASSSSGLLPSEMQAAVRYPERLLVGHPFNPVYLMPLVEIVGGEHTSSEARETAADFYRSIGMHPLQVRREVDAFLADRMMEALWREALHLVDEGIATTDEIDQAICYGPGLRWAFMGSFLVYRVAGGEGGMRHFMEQFGPSLKWPWTRFDGPDLTDDLLDRIADQSDDQADGRSIVELEQLRDDCLVAVMQGLRGQNYAAGEVLARYEEKLYAVDPAVTANEDVDISRPLTLYRGRVSPQWVDYNNHMTESAYLQAFGDGSDALFRLLGIDEQYRAGGHSYFTVETHINYLREMEGGQPFSVTTQLLGGDEKRIHLFHTMHTGDGEVAATTEQMLMHVSSREGRACPVSDEVLAKLEPIIRAHAELPDPTQAGRSVGAAR